MTRSVRPLRPGLIRPPLPVVAPVPIPETRLTPQPAKAVPITPAATDDDTDGPRILRVTAHTPIGRQLLAALQA